MTNITDGGLGMTTTSAKQLAKNEEWKQKQREGVIKKYQDPVRMRSITEINKNRAQDPEFRKKQLEGIKKSTQDAEWRKNVSEANRKKAQDPTWRNRSG